MTTTPSSATKALFWLSMVVAVVTSLIIFRDLADISQWIVQPDRETMMWTWYNRHWVAGIGLVGVALAIVLRVMSPALMGKGLFIGLLALTSFLFYSGLINPEIMMRERQENGVFVSVEEAKKYLADDESVIVIEVNGKARAHADKDLLRPHVAGSGTIGGENVIMTYCGLTNLGMAVIPEINGQALHLRPMTQIKNNLVLVDSNSGEPIQQLWLKKERDMDEKNAPSMREWPSFRMPFAKFALAYPEGEVFINDYIIDSMKPGFLDNPVYAIFDPLTDIVFTRAVEFQANNEAPTFPTVEYSDSRLPSKEKVWAFNVGDDYVAYTEAFVKSQNNLVNTQVGGKPIVVAYDETYQSLGIYYNTSAGPVTNIDFFGNSNAGKLPRVETVKAGAYWIVWSNFFEDTDINRI